MLFRHGSNGKTVIFLNLIVACTLGLLLSTSITTQQIVNATAVGQETNQVFVLDTAGTEYELKLRATEEDGRIDTVPSFTLEAERVPQVDEGKDLVLNVKIIDPSTGQLVPDSRVVDNIKVTDPNTGQVIKEVKPTASNIFSLLGVKPGIYQLDAIVQLTDDTKGAYEGILTILAPGQDAPPTDQIQNVQKTVITRDPDPIFIPVPVAVPVPVPTTQVSPSAPPQPLAGQQQQSPQPLAGQQTPTPPTPQTSVAPPQTLQAPPPPTSASTPPTPAAQGAIRCQDGQPPTGNPVACPPLTPGGPPTSVPDSNTLPPCEFPNRMANCAVPPEPLQGDCPTGIEKGEDCPTDLLGDQASPATTTPLGQQQQPPQPLAGQQQLLGLASPPVVDPCIQDPALLECQLPPPVDPCIQYPTLPECQPSQEPGLQEVTEPTAPVNSQASQGQSETDDGTSGEGEDEGGSEGETGSEDGGDGGDED